MYVCTKTFSMRRSATALSTKPWKEYKSPLRVVVQFLQRSLKAKVLKCNEQGLFRGAADGLRKLVGSASHTTAKQLANKLIDFVAAAECQLNEGERLPMSTEILESSFALYKQLEGQHSKCGFTSLLASFGSLLKPQTPEMIHRAFSRVSVQDVKKWADKNLGRTLTSKRRATHNEFNSNTNGAKIAAVTT